MKTLRLPLLLAVCLALPATAIGAPTASTAPLVCASDAALPGATSFTVGTLHVRKYGDHGRPLILVPGLGSGAWVWNGSVERLRRDHVMYTVTLAGFDGTPPPARMTGLLDQAEDSLLKLIQQQHLDHPVLIGHSVGGTLGIRFAEKHSDLLSGVVAVDGLPVFPSMSSMTPQQRAASVEKIRASMANATQDQFKGEQVRYMQFVGVRDPKLGERCGALQGRSDAKVVAEVAAEDFLDDARPGLKQIKVPVLEISPYNADDFKRVAAMGKQPLITEQAKAEMYKQLLAGTPDVKVVSIADARHFAMLDQPAKFDEILTGFIADLSKQR